LPGDYIAWHVACEGEPKKAFELGLSMLPGADCPPPLRVYNDNERAAGAMLLALAARTARQKQIAVDRIAARLDAGEFDGEVDFYTAGAFRCALLILGRKPELAKLRALRGIGRFPRRRVMTALCAAGDREALDWLLFNKDIPPEDISSLLTGRGIGEVLQAFCPELPLVDAAAETDLRLWQVRILRHHWGVRRGDVRLGMDR